MIQSDANGLYHPANEVDIIELVSHAVENKLQVRVRGAAQSVKAAVVADGSGNITMELDQLRAVSINKATMQVTVGGGCNLAFDPFDPSAVSAQSDSNNLFFQLNQAGLAIPNVSNAIHQTVAGFISTGSSGGTMQHSFDECILAVRMIDGTGTIQTFTKSDNLDDDFYGVVVSMGLLGIITQVTLQCIPAFNIYGMQVVTPENDTEFDFFGPGSAGKPSLQTYITNTEFSRILWWPFKSLQRTIAWKAKTMQPGDYTATTGTPEDFKPQPYQPLFPKILGSRLLSETIASTGFQLIATWPDWFYALVGNSDREMTPAETQLFNFTVDLFPYIYPVLTNMYFPCNTPDKNPPNIFWDNWLDSLPMDKFEYSNNLFNLTYSEMWIPAGKAQDAVNILQQHYIDTGYTGTGFYTVEILAAKKSNFWLSPAYNTDVVRINILFFKNSAEKAMDYYGQFWQLLQQNNISFRPHWGKKLPLPNSSTGPAYLQSQYPKWSNFMALRKKMDPQNVFLNTYWKEQLGIETA